MKYPEITVQLSGEDGNAFAIIATVRNGLKNGGIDKDEISSISKEMMSGSYDELIQTAMKYVDVQ